MIFSHKYFYMKNIKEIWIREEIKIADDLLLHVPELIDEFLAYHCDFVNGDFSKGNTIDIPTLTSPSQYTSTPNAWKGNMLKYALPHKDFYQNDYKDTKIINQFPTACSIIEKYQDVCLCAGYSAIENNSVITRHRGSEDQHGEYIRIHVPLIVPVGDIFFEVSGAEIDWSDIFGFDDRCAHSAHNLSNQRRLAFLIDIRRDFLGIPNGGELTPTPEFIRGSLPKILHRHQQ